jgi:hypothetical protein
MFDGADGGAFGTGAIIGELGEVGTRCAGACNGKATGAAGEPPSVFKGDVTGATVFTGDLTGARDAVIGCAGAIGVA